MDIVGAAAAVDDIVVVAAVDVVIAAETVDDVVANTTEDVVCQVSDAFGRAEGFRVVISKYECHGMFFLAAFSLKLTCADFYVGSGALLGTTPGRIVRNRHPCLHLCVWSDPTAKGSKSKRF